MIGVDLLKAMSADFRHWVQFSRLVYNLTSIKLDTSVGSYLINVRRFGFWDWGLRKACMFFKRVPQVLTSDPISQLLTPITMERYNSLTEYASNLLYYHQQFMNIVDNMQQNVAIVQQNQQYVAIVQQNLSYNISSSK